MKTDDIIDAVADLSDETIEQVGKLREAHRADTVYQKRSGKIGKIWWIAAACLLLVIGIFRIFPTGSGTTIFHRTVSDGESGIYYYSYKKSFLSRRYRMNGVWHYDSASDTADRIADSGILLDTSLGPVLLEEGCYYLLDGTEKKLIGDKGLRDQADPRFIEFIDIDRDYAYYVKRSEQLYRESLSTGNAELLVDLSDEKDRFIFTRYAFVYGGKVYYNDFIQQNGIWNMVYNCLDPETGTISQLPRIHAESGADFTAALGVKVYDRYLVTAGNDLGIRVTDLETGELRTFETGHADTGFGIDRGYLYISVRNEFRKYDLATGESTSAENMCPPHTQELVIQNDGAYYTVTGGNDIGLYYYRYCDKISQKID